MLNVTLIKTRMSESGLSQTALASQCDVSKEAVSNWLAGESIPRPNKLKQLSTALGIALKELFVPDDEFPEPVVAYRTKKNRVVTGPAFDAALDMAHHLQQLLPFVRSKRLFAPAVLESPGLDPEYVRDVARQVRKSLGLSATCPVTREQLLELLHDFGALLVPVLWGGAKAGHENALSVYLPEEKASWVVFNLNAKNEDFNYWLAHELGHCYTLHCLQGDDGEQFAEAFAQELLFPLDAAIEALKDINACSSAKERASWYAGTYGISILTVIRQADKAAAHHGLAGTGLETPAFWKAHGAKINSLPTIAEEMFGVKALSAEEYVFKSQEVFKTPVFTALAGWQREEGGRSPAFIASALNISVTQALELSHLLLKIHDCPRESADSPNKT